MNQRSKNITLFFSNVFFAFCIYICFCIYNLFLPICSWHRLLHDHDRHRLGHRPHPLRKLQLQVESHTKIAIQAARPGVPRHIGHRWRCRCHPAARPSSGQATLLIGTLLPASPSSARRERWEITVGACKLYAPNLPETTMIRAIPILADLFRSWGPVEEGGREEITYDLTNLTWQVGT